MLAIVSINSWFPLRLPSLDTNCLLLSNQVKLEDILLSQQLTGSFYKVETRPDLFLHRNWSKLADQFGRIDLSNNGGRRLLDTMRYNDGYDKPPTAQDDQILKAADRDGPTCKMLRSGKWGVHFSANAYLLVQQKLTCLAPFSADLVPIVDTDTCCPYCAYPLYKFCHLSCKEPGPFPLGVRRMAPEMHYDWKYEPGKGNGQQYLSCCKYLSKDKKHCV